MKLKKFTPFAVLLILLLVMVACGSPEPEIVEVIKEVPVEQVVVETVEVEVERVVEVEVTTAMEEPEAVPYNLTPGKPFDGTTINFLICCPTAGQFVAWEKSKAEFTELTGIEV